MKKVWRVFFDDNDLYTKKNDREDTWDTCAICRVELGRWCIDCFYFFVYLFFPISTAFFICAV